jgi:hypothetical protein
MKDNALNEYCIVFTAGEFEEKHYYYVYAKNIENALKRFRKHENQREVIEIKEIRLLGNEENERTRKAD